MPLDPERNNSLRAAIFDLDGTLHDRDCGIRAFATDQYARIGTNTLRSTEYVQRFVELDSGGLVWKDKVYAKLLEEFELTGNHAVEHLVDDYVQHYPAFAVEFENSSKILGTLRSSGFRIGILTNGPGQLQRSVISSLGFDDMVDAIVVSEETGYKKPQREIFELMLDQLGVNANNAIMIGDSIEADVEGAVAIGASAIAFNTKDNQDRAITCYTMTDVLDNILSRIES